MRPTFVEGNYQRQQFGEPCTCALPGLDHPCQLAAAAVCSAGLRCRLRQHLPHAGSSVQHHFLAAYKASLAAVCAAQLHAKGFEGSASKVVNLLERGSLQVPARRSHRPASMQPACKPKH